MEITGITADTSGERRLPGLVNPEYGSEKHKPEFDYSDSAAIPKPGFLHIHLENGGSDDIRFDAAGQPPCRPDVRALHCMYSNL